MGTRFAGIEEEGREGSACRDRGCGDGVPAVMNRSFPQRRKRRREIFGQDLQDFQDWIDIECHETRFAGMEMALHQLLFP